MWVVISLLAVLADDCAPMLYLEPECHPSFDIAHGYDRGSGWLVTTCQEVRCVFEVLKPDI